MTAQPHILIVEDEQITSLAWCEELCDAGYQVSTASQAIVAREILRTQSVSALITDGGLPDMSGDAFALQSRNDFPFLPIIMVTGFGPEQLGRIAPHPKLRVLQKPIESRTLLDCLQSML
jgi:DNA-binding response OmpR family regulator